MTDKLNIIFKNNKFIFNELKKKINDEKFIDFSMNNLDQYNIDNNNINFVFKNKSYDYNCIRKLFELTINYKSKKMIKSNFKLGMMFGFYNLFNIIRFLNIIPSLNSKIKFKQKKYNVIKTSSCSRNTMIYYDLFNNILESTKQSKITIAMKVPFEKDKNNISDGYVIIDFYKGMSLYQLELILIHNLYQIYVTNLLINIYYKFYNILSFLNLNNIDKYFLKKIDVVCEVFNTNSKNNSEIYINYGNKFSNYNLSILFISIFIKLMGDRKKANAYVSFNY